MINLRTFNFLHLFKRKNQHQNPEDLEQIIAAGIHQDVLRTCKYRREFSLDEAKTLFKMPSGKHGSFTQEEIKILQKFAGVD
ncbi:MAG: hypothetical protein JW740_03430 [Candidatus Zambryskibacteria bacterium]|nr:hypothetical protein [Candidatus Zambryskibacteria bacterium]